MQTPLIGLGGKSFKSRAGDLGHECKPPLHGRVGSTEEANLTVSGALSDQGLMKELERTRTYECNTLVWSP